MSSKNVPRVKVEPVDLSNTKSAAVDVFATSIFRPENIFFSLSSSSSEYNSSPEGTSPVNVTAEGPSFYTQPRPPSLVSPTVDSAQPTPLISNTAIRLLQLVQNTFATSPIQARVLEYKVTPIESPVVCACRVPRGYRIMSDAGDADDETLYDDRSDSLSDNGTEEAVQLVQDSDLVDAGAISLTDIARSMVNEPLDSTMTEAEVALVMNSSVNTKEYEKNKKGIEARFFDTIERYGSNLLKQLTRYAMDGFRQERLFYIKWRGEKTDEKKFILKSA
jgi:hypothetical protein